jgi:hypothetical protein
MPTSHLLLHLPEKGKRLESSPELIEEYRALAEEQGYAWLCKPSAPLDPALRRELEMALQQGEEIRVYLFVRLSMDDRQLALYRAKLLGIQGPGPNADTEHTLSRFRGCGTWLKLADLGPAAADQIRRLYDAQTDQPVPIWTDLSTDLHLVIEGEPWVGQPEEPCYSYWLLCLGQARTRAEFDHAWRFRPIATYQPGSVEFIEEHKADTSQRVLVYDRIFGGPTYLAILGIYEVTELLPQGTTAGALLYTAQLREVASFSSMPRLDPRQDEGLWGQLDIAQRPDEWEALISKERVLAPLSEDDYQRILIHAGHKVAVAGQCPAKSADVVEEDRASSAMIEPNMIDLARSLSELEAITAKSVSDVTETECYHLLRTLERALRAFIDRELSRVSQDWWAEGRLPQDSCARAEERKQKREHPFPWLSQQNLPSKEYLDFSDYAEIITMDRNWNEVFEPMFVRPEVIRGKLIELGILRNDIAHMRELKPADKEAFIATGRQLLLTISDRLS